MFVARRFAFFHFPKILSLRRKEPLRMRPLGIVQAFAQGFLTDRSR
jgi:hypothetical protein